MRLYVGTTLLLGLMAARGLAQEIDVAGPTIHGGEPLYAYDDPEPWKHGWFQVVPYYGGRHSFRPYNYKQVFSQSAQAREWGMPQQMPYSQQFYHRYRDVSGEGVPPLQSIQPRPCGPHPSAVHRSRWNALPSSALTKTGYDHRHGAAAPHPLTAKPVQRTDYRSPADTESQRQSIQRAQLEQWLQQAVEDDERATLYEPVPAPPASVE